MKPRARHRYPPDKRLELKKARRLEWLTILFLLTIIGAMYVAMGSSQSMKTAWIEDLLSLIPPIVFLVAAKHAEKAPDRCHPYGHRRAMLLSFLAAAAAILVFGVYMLYDSLASLLTRHHPTIGHFSFHGLNWQVWAGWPMIGALIYSMIPPMILGRLKLRSAKELHLKTLHADAAMNKDDWMTAGAAAAGVVGVGFGLWWADAVAAAAISLNVLKDGFVNIKRSMSDLTDQRPTEIGSDRPLRLEERIEERLRSQRDVADAAVRLREEGSFFTGEAFVVFHSGQADPARLEELRSHATRIDWRLADLIVAPARSLSDRGRPELADPAER